MAIVPPGAPLRAPDEAAASKMGAVSAPRVRTLTVSERPFDPHWRQRAACQVADAVNMVPARSGSAAESRRAKAVCYGCPVRLPCLRWALRTGEKRGVYGGLTYRERSALLREHQPSPRTAVAA